MLHNAGVQHDPTARPTLRLLAELTQGWEDPHERRAITDERWDAVQPLSHLSHPILDKCRDLLNTTTSDAPAANRTIACSRDLRLLRRETVAKILTDWERLVQELARRLLEQAMRDGHSRLAVPHPTEPAPLTTVDLEFSADDDIEEFVLSFIDHTQRGSQLAYLLERRLLTSIAPPQQDWDVAGGIYSAMEAPGHGNRQVARLQEAVKNSQLLESVPGEVAHRAHRLHIGDAAVQGTAVRALCGVFFVPRTDPTDLPYCEECSRRYARLSAF